MEKKDTLSSCSESEEQQMKLIQDKSKESCMVSFQRLHSHLKRLSNNDLKGSQTENGSGRAFATLFGQDFETFTGTMFLNMDQLQKQLDNNKFQEIGSMASFKSSETQFQMFINSQIYLNDEYIVMTCNYFLQYTQLDIPEFRETLVQFMEYVKKSIDERALHKIEYDSRVNERRTQTTEEKIDTSNALDALDARQQHTEQPESNNEGEVDQNADQCYDTRPLPAKLTDNTKTELSFNYSEFEINGLPPIDVSNDLSKSVTTHYLPKRRESAPAKPHYMIATSSSRWVPTGKTFASSTTKVDSEPPNGSNADITNQCESEQALDVSPADQASVFMAMMSVHISSGLVLHQMTSDHNRSDLRIQDHSNEQSSSKLVPKVGIQSLRANMGTNSGSCHSVVDSDQWVVLPVAGRWPSALIDDKLYIVAGSHNGSYLSDFQNQVPFTLEQQRRTTSMLNTLVYNAMSQNISWHNRPSPIVVAARTHEVQLANIRSEDSMAISSMHSVITTTPHVFPFEERYAQASL
ncbi:hypothetical protein Tco_0782232 [Tanacetum coccineum]